MAKRNSHVFLAVFFAFGAGFSGAATAADLWGARDGGSIKDAPIVARTVDWTGFYIGGQGSYQWSGADVNWDYDLPGLGTGASLSTDGWMGGVHAGVQKQIGRWVFGVDLSGDWGKSSDTAKGDWTDGGDFLCTGFGCAGRWDAAGAESIRASIDRIFTASGRLGYAWDNWLVYAKGGYASAEISTALKMAGEAEGCVLFVGCASAAWDAKGSTEKTHQGWTLGGGVAYMIARNVSFGIDYSYINLGSETHKGSLNGEVGGCVGNNCAGIDFTTDHRVRVNPDDIHMVSARLTFHFNGTD